MTESGPRLRFIASTTPGARASALPADPAAVGAPMLLHGLRRHVHGEERQRADDGEVFLLQSVYRKIMRHLRSDVSRELGGLLVGLEIRDGAGRPAILIRDALPARHTSSTRTRLTFSEETWADWDRELGDPESQGAALQRVGWYHSHPGMGIFLSTPDLDVCKEFRRPTQVALVVDPVEPKGGFFVRGAEGFRDRNPQGFWELEDEAPGSAVDWQSTFAQPEMPWSFLSWLAPEVAAPPSPAAEPARAEPAPEESARAEPTPEAAAPGEPAPEQAAPGEAVSEQSALDDLPAGARRHRSILVALVAAFALAVLAQALVTSSNHEDDHERRLLGLEREIATLKADVESLRQEVSLRQQPDDRRPGASAQAGHPRPGEGDRTWWP
jgi:proteasome lid subunit RPN8/RPN11